MVKLRITQGSRYLRILKQRRHIQLSEHPQKTDVRGTARTNIYNTINYTIKARYI